MQKYLLEIGNIAPANCIPLEIPPHEGIHTGGIWYNPKTDEVFKPLDVRPYANAPVRVDSEEEIALSSLTHLPGFPRNWRVEESNGRRWLVRPRCKIYGRDLSVDRPIAIEVMGAIIGANLAGWELNEINLTVALDPDGHNFILDLSAATYRHDANDNFALENWLCAVGHSDVWKCWHQGYVIKCDAAIAHYEEADFLFGPTPLYVYEAPYPDIAGVEGEHHKTGERRWISPQFEAGAIAQLCWTNDPVALQAWVACNQKK